MQNVQLVKFTILTEVDSQQQSFPPLSFKNVTTCNHFSAWAINMHA